MPKPNKLNMPLQQYTAFWRSLGVTVRNRNRTNRHYSSKSDMATLKRVNVSAAAIDKVLALCQTYSDTLLFRNFSKFFRKDVETVKAWTRKKTATAAFEKLFDIFHKNTPENAKKKLMELFLIFEFYKKGEQQLYLGTAKSNLAVKNFSTKNLRRRLTRSGKNSDYIEKGSAILGRERIIWLQKNTEGKKTEKFIKISKERTILNVALSMDSKREYYITKHELEKKFDVFLDTPTMAGDFRKMFLFLKTGKSEHFTLSGATFRDAEFRVSILPAHNRIENVTELEIYKSKISTDAKKLQHLTQMRLVYNDRSLNRPIFISLFTYQEGIFGAILLHPDDKKLTSVQRKNLYINFQKDFDLSLNQFIEHDDLTEKVLYRLFLESVPSRIGKMELRSKTALQIYTTLIGDQLILPNTATEEVSKICVNSVCANKFKPVWNAKQYCLVCKEILINGRSVEIRTIDEANVAEFLEKKFTAGNVNTVTRTVLSRKIKVVQVLYNDETVDLIPMTKNLSDSQLSLLRVRFPHSVFITSRQNKDELISKNIPAISLWEVAYSIYKNEVKEIKDLALDARAQSLDMLRKLSTSSLNHIADTDFYKDKNGEIKNLGAELFEADCSVLFDYVFGNCLWLGAKYKGKSLPDGFTAFPMLGTTKGCFIWDGKFSEGKALVMGNFAKNIKYIDDARKNKSLKINGGLKGFVFISNNVFPASFIKKYTPLIKGRKIKITFIRADQFQKITRHYKRNEKLILNNSGARDQFVYSMTDIFFKTGGGRKCEITSDARIDSNIKADNNYFATLRPGRPLAP